MKLRRLDLLRYGHLANVTLDFPDTAGLHVVFGANEAGKSTALAAIADALFGFGHRTDYDFLHGGPRLRIGFSLTAQDGTTGDFIRRKGRTNTLTDAADQPVAEETLRRFLGGATRELFERGFGLDGVRLREGGQALLRSGGEAGESLLAGAGLLHLRSALTNLDEEARTLVGDGRGKRRLSEATDAYRQARRAAEDRAIAPRAWQDADAAHTAAVAALAEMQAAARNLAAEDSRLQRVRRVAQRLAALDVARSVHASLADLPLLPPDTATRRDASDAERRDAGRDAERETAEADRLTIALAGLTRDPKVLAARDAIEALAARRPIAQQAETDRPKVRAAAATQREKVADSVQDLGIAVQPEAARDALPPTGVRRGVQRLIVQRGEWAAKAAAAEQAVATARHRHDRAAADLTAHPAPLSPALARRTIDAVRGEGPLDTALDRAERALAAAADAVAKALAGLPLWSGDLAGLAAIPIPLPASCDAAAQRLAAADTALTAVRAQAARLTTDLATVEADITRLAQGETVPTPEAVATIRVRRDEVWRRIRRVLEGGPDPDAEEAALGYPPDLYESLRDEADRLADRRAEDAQRVADFLGATARRDLLRAGITVAEQATATAEATASAAVAAWRALWQPTGLTPDTPAAMADWRRQRADVLSLADRSDDARRARDDVAVRRDQARSALLGVLEGAASDENLSRLLLRADTACAEQEAAVEAHRRRAEAVQQEESRLPELLDAQRAAVAGLEAWDAQWAAAIAALGLPPDTTTDAAESALGAWTRIAEAAPSWRENERRVAEMTTAIDDFAAATRALLAVLEEPDLGDPPAAIAAGLARRLAAALTADEHAASLSEQHGRHRDAAAAATRRHDAAEVELAALRTAAGAADDAELVRVIEQIRQRDAAATEIAAREAALLAQGDGLPEATLRDEAAATDPDAVMARLADIATDMAALGDRREQLSAERTRAEATLTEMRAGHDAAAKAQEAEDALADARAAAERYATLHVARVLLRSGIDRFRAEQQDPLLRAASAHFVRLTGGRYTRLSTGDDSAGRTVLLAATADGDCPVEGLSEGTRDQLFLALRIAAIQAHAVRAEPLPFIADDLLVHFDDQRADYALRLLAELGSAAQVILFTHHERIAELAAEQRGAVVHRMPGVAI